MHLRCARPVAAVVLATLVAAGCGDDSAPSVGSSDAVTTEVTATTDVPTTSSQVPTSAVPTSPVPTSPVPTSAVPTTQLPTTTNPAPAGWEAAGPMPSLAYPPCCATNFVGNPSPEIPADDATALAPGIYWAFRDQPADGETVDTTTITFSVAPFVACGTPGISCEQGFVGGEVGVGDVARVVTLPLNGDIAVVVGGFACTDEGQAYETDHQSATGIEFAALQTELDAAFTAEVAPLVDAGTAFEDVATIFAEPRGGFSVPCLMAGQLQFQGSTGPTILLQRLGTYDDTVGRVVVLPSISIAVINLTALEVADDGSQTLYFYAGFLS